MARGVDRGIEDGLKGAICLSLRRSQRRRKEVKADRRTEVDIKCLNPKLARRASCKLEFFQGVVQLCVIAAENGCGGVGGVL